MGRVERLHGRAAADDTLSVMSSVRITAECSAGRNKNRRSTTRAPPLCPSASFSRETLTGVTTSRDSRSRPSFITSEKSAHALTADLNAKHALTPANFAHRWRVFLRVYFRCGSGRGHSRAELPLTGGMQKILMLVVVEIIRMSYFTTTPPKNIATRPDPRLFPPFQSVS